MHLDFLLGVTYGAFLPKRRETCLQSSVEFIYRVLGVSFKRLISQSFYEFFSIFVVGALASIFTYSSCYFSDSLVSFSLLGIVQYLAKRIRGILTLFFGGYWSHLKKGLDFPLPLQKNFFQLTSLWLRRNLYQMFGFEILL